MYSFKIGIFCLLVSTLYGAQDIYAQFPLGTTGNIVPDQSACINGEDYLLDLSAFYEIESEFFVEYVVVAGDLDIPDVFDRPILGVTEFEFDGIDENSCNYFDISSLDDATLVPILFRQSELDDITINPLAGGVIGAMGGESFQEFVQLFPEITAVPLPEPLTLNSVLGLWTNATIIAIVGFTPTIVASPNYTSPDPSFEFNECRMDFRSTSNSDFEIESVSWDFGDGNGSETFEPGPILYDSPGFYDVTMVICNGIGCDSITQSIDIPPITITIPNQAEIGQPLAFSFESDLYTDQSWVFGDGAISFDQYTEHSYDEPGFYTVELILTNDGIVGCTLDYSEVIEVVGNVGITDVINGSLQISPNPTTDLAIIDIPESFLHGSLSVLNISGKEVFLYEMIGGKTYELETSHLVSGIYVIQLMSDQGDRLTSKLLVN